MLRALAKKVYLDDRVQAAIKLGVDVAGRDRSLVEQYLRGHPRAKLQIGAGDNVRAGWLNTNWYPIRPWGARTIFLDATRPFPLPDNAFDLIFTEHMIEHVHYDQGQIMLKECCRVLKPGGTIRISTPDMKFLTSLLAPTLSDLQQRYVAWASKTFLKNGQPHTALSVVNNFVRDWGHMFIYDAATLEAALRQSGFVAIKRCAVNRSDVPDLDGIDHPERFPHPEFLELESMVFEASKPATSA